MTTYKKNKEMLQKMINSSNIVLDISDINVPAMNFIIRYEVRFLTKQLDDLEEKLKEKLEDNNIVEILTRLENIEKYNTIKIKLIKLEDIKNRINRINRICDISVCCIV